MKISLTYINIGGKKRPFKYGTNASALLCEKRGIQLKDLAIMFNQEKLNNYEIDGTEIRDLIWAGLHAGAKSKNIDVDFTEWTVGDWLDDIDVNEFVKVFEAMADSQSPEKKKVKKK